MSAAEKMAKALHSLQAKMTVEINGADETCFIIGMRKQVTESEMRAISEALAAYEAEKAAP